MQMVLTKSLVSEDNPLEQRMVKEVWFFTGAETRTKIDEREQRQREGDKPAPISHQPEVRAEQYRVTCLGTSRRQVTVTAAFGVFSP